MIQASQPTAAQILVDGLLANGVDTIFGVPGESYLSVLDALYDSGIRFINCRQEGGAAMAAAAQGRLSGKPGICMVTRGPGATNASAGLHVAFQDSMPMILFIGQVASDQADREAFQEVDYRRMFGQMAKWVAQVDEPSRMAEYVSRAFHIAQSGRPGPVVLALPEDMLRKSAGSSKALPAAKPIPAAPTEEALADLRRHLAEAKKPFLLIGGGGWSQTACDDIRRFAEANALPVGVSFRAQDLSDNEHPLYAGHVGIGIDPALGTAIQDSDLLLVVGPRLGEMTTGGYQLIEPPRSRQPLIHIHADIAELGRVYYPDLAIAADMGSAARALAGLGRIRSGEDGRAAKLHQAYLTFSTPHAEPSSAMDMSHVVAYMQARLPQDTVICNGAGNYSVWLHRFFRYRRLGTQLAPSNGSMGFGTPAALASALSGRPTLAMSGDGCLMMTVQELATAAQYGAKLIQIVVNNGIYGTIRTHQERNYPGRVFATEMGHGTDFAALGRAMGLSGERVETLDQFKAAFDRALAADGPALIEVLTDPDILSPTATVAGLRAMKPSPKSAT